MTGIALRVHTDLDDLLRLGLALAPVVLLVLGLVVARLIGRLRGGG